MKYFYKNLSADFLLPASCLQYLALSGVSFWHVKSKGGISLYPKLAVFELFLWSLSFLPVSCHRMEPPFGERCWLGESWKHLDWKRALRAASPAFGIGHHVQIH